MSPFIEDDRGTERAPAHDGEEARPAQTITSDASHGTSAEADYLKQELTALYAAFIERLDDRDRMFFKARFQEQKTQVEAGEVCGLSHMQSGTVEKKLRERFLKYMHQKGYLEDYGAGTQVRTA